MAGIDIAVWLGDLGLAQYREAFAKNAVDAEILLELTAEDLRELGVEQVGHRRKILAAIAALRAGKGEAAEAAAPAVPASPAERRLLTVMFCDLVGSTALSTRLDPEDLREVIGAYHRSVAETIGRYGGFVAKYMGDGVLAYFGYPEAHEDDAEEAVRAALALVGEIGRQEAPERLKLRAGIATGLVVVGDLIGSGAAQEYRVVGETPNLAARLQAMAPENGVLIGEATRRLVGDLFEYRELGAVEIKGFEAAVPVFEVLRPSAVESRFEALRAAALTPLVGREEEIELLLRRWRRAAEGEGQAVLICGEPGIGKSRLAAVLRDRLAGEAHTRVRYFSSPHHQDSALYPFIAQLERAAKFEREDPLEKKLDKLEALLAPASPPAEDLGLLAELLSLEAASRYPLPPSTPQRRKEKTFAALLQQFEALARQKPLLVVFEDLHWIDPSSRELLDRMVERLASLPVLLLATFRPEFAPPWNGLPQVTALTLSRLDRRTGAAMVAGVAGTEALSGEVTAEIVERADGIPLFVEELTKAVLEAGGGSEGVERTLVGAPSPTAAVPAALHAPLMARLDRLGQTAKEIAQIAAAIGREFSYELIAAVTPRSEAETRAALDQLAAAGLVFQRGTPPAAEYRFKHALVQDTAYRTLLRGPRQALHGRIATAMLQQPPEIVRRAPEILAHHLTEAGDLDNAAAYWLEAGRHASGNSANIEAAAHLTRGIVTLRGLTETPERNWQELAMQLVLGPALMSNRGYNTSEVREAYRRAGELARRLDDDRARFAATWGMWLTAESGGESEYDDPLPHLDELVETAERIGDPELSLQARHSAWATWLWSGQFTRSVEHARQGLALYDPGKHRHHALMYGGHDPGVCGKGHNAVALWALGYPDQALQSAQEGVALGEKLGHLPSVLHSLTFAAILYFLRRDMAAARDCGARLLALGQEHGLAQYQAAGGTYYFWALAEMGNGEDALAKMRSHLRLLGTTMRITQGALGAGLAEAELRSGNLEQASAALAEAEDAGYGWCQSDILRVRGDLQRRGSGEGDRGAEQPYLEAISIAQDQQAKSFELRSAAALARLWVQHGRRPEARDLLAPLYGWFTEGFDTPDLKEAKALLDALA